MKLEANQEPSHSSSSISATLQPKNYMIAAISFRDCPMDVITSAKKKSLNLTVPKGEIKIYQMVLPNSDLAVLYPHLKNG